MKMFGLIGIVGASLLGSSAHAACSSLLQHAFRPLASQSEPAPLCEAYAGKVLLIVNTASKMASLEKKPESSGRPASAAAPMVKVRAVMGIL